MSNRSSNCNHNGLYDKINTIYFNKVIINKLGYTINRNKPEITI